MTFGERLKMCRTTRKMSQQRLASKSGVGSSTISNYECDRCEPTLLFACCLAKTLDVPLEFLAGMLDENEEREVWLRIMSKKELNANYKFMEWLKSHEPINEDGGC